MSHKSIAGHLENGLGLAFQTPFITSSILLLVFYLVGYTNWLIPFLVMGGFFIGYTLLLYCFYQLSRNMVEEIRKHALKALLFYLGYFITLSLTILISSVINLPMEIDYVTLKSRMDDPFFTAFTILSSVFVVISVIICVFALREFSFLFKAIIDEYRTNQLPITTTDADTWVKNQPSILRDYGLIIMSFILFMTTPIAIIPYAYIVFYLGEFTIVLSKGIVAIIILLLSILNILEHIKSNKLHRLFIKLEKKYPEEVESLE